MRVPRANLKDATIVFDLDGTLVDTAPDLTNALNDALTSRGPRPISQATIRSAVGFSARVDDPGSVPARQRPTRCWPSSSSTTKPTSPLSRPSPVLSRR
jgi:hypothetical protein